MERDAEHVILAIPFTLLRQVALRLELPPVKRRVINELGYGTNAKLLASTPHVSGAVCITPVVLCIQTTACKICGCGAWTRGGQRYSHHISRWEKRCTGRSRHQKPGSWRRCHGLRPFSRARSDIPSRPCPPYALAECAVCAWELCSVSSRANGVRRDRGPAGVGNLHFCGEHTSVAFQGFMEGACATGPLRRRLSCTIWAYPWSTS